MNKNKYSLIHFNCVKSTEKIHSNESEQCVPNHRNALRLPVQLLAPNDLGLDLPPPENDA